MSGPFGSSQWMASTGSSKFYTKTIDNSLRFDGSTSYLSRTGVVGNNQKWTWSGWVKKCDPKLSDYQWLFCASTGSTNRTDIFFSYDATYGYDTITFYGNNGAICYYKTSAMFRDVAGWYHIVVSVDGSLADGSKTKIYVNGIQQATSYSGTFTTTPINTTASHYIGSFWSSPPAYVFDGYITETYLIDGYALDHTSFGEFKNGVWIAKTYVGSYGNNGHYLDFADNTSATTLGYDVSGNSNNFTPSGIATSDQMLDSPTNNFCTLNPLNLDNATLSEGNLKFTGSASDYGKAYSTIIPVDATGKYYAEMLLGNAVSAYDVIVVYTVYEGIFASYRLNGDSFFDNSNHVGYLDSITTGDIVGVFVDCENDEVIFYKNGVAQTAIAPTQYSVKNGFIIAARDTIVSASQISTMNFGQDSSFVGSKTRQNNTDANGYGDFYYTPPTGALAICTQNLPDPTFDPAQGASPLDAFNSVLYDGNGTDAHAITGVGFSPDFVWIKARGPNTRYHRLTDTIRGATKSVTTNDDFSEVINSTHLQSFDADGFTVGTQNSFNASGETYVAWNWKANGTGSTNTDGSITTTVSVNQNAGVSIIKYTGNGTSGATIGHGLDDTPKFIIVKNRTNAGSWLIYHKAVSSTPQNSYLVLNTTASLGTNSTAWNNTAPNTSVVTLGNSVWCNENTAEFIAYCFSEKEGFSKFGSYVGNGSADGAFIYTGFKPAFVMTKTLSTGGWLMSDNVRPGYNQNDDTLLADGTAIEGAYQSVDLLSNGFKLRSVSTNTAYYSNVNGDTSIYLAFAESPFKYSLGA